MTIRTLALFTLFSVGVISCFAAPQSSAPAATTTAQKQNGIIIGPDDGVTIVALEAEEISKTWRVSTTGDLNLPMVGTVHAGGLTAGQLEQELTAKLKKFIRNPQVTVYISEFRSNAVTVVGAVGKPGTFQTEGPKTLLTVLMMAGGVNKPGPTLTVTRDTRNGTIPLPEAHSDPDGKYSTVELKLKDVLDASTSAANLEIRPDDVISVSILQRLVYIIGEVNHPGAVELVTRDSVSLMQVLASAGGLTKISAPHHTEIMRVNSKGLYEKVASIDLKSVMSGKKEDRLLKDGDIIVVPSSNLKTYSQAATFTAISTGIYILSRY